MSLSRTFHWQPADMAFNPSIPLGSVNLKHIRDENQHPIFLLSNSSSWRENCGYIWELTTTCNFYSLERYKHESLMESPAPPLAEDLLRFLHLNIQYQVITLLSSRTCTTIIYTSSAFYIIEDFITLKATAQTLNPLRCYSSTIKEAL